jgi:hypothetical protein
MMLGHYIYLKSCYNDKYLSVSNDGRVYFNQIDKKNCDLLKMRYEGKYITLKRTNGKYLSLNYYYGTLDSDKDIITDNERFEIEWINDNIFALKANNGFYISVQKDDRIEVNNKKIDLNAQLNMIPQKDESLYEFLGF